MGIKALETDVLPQVVRVQRWSESQWEEKDDLVSREVSVEIRFPGGSCRLWAWPEGLKYLAHGHAVLDCMHPGPQDGPPPCGMNVSVVEECGGIFNIIVHERDGCVPLSGGPAADPGHVDAANLLRYMSMLTAMPGLWEVTGCFHRAAMVDLSTGKFICVVEDIGRHNCIDRIMGLAMHKNLNPAAHALLVSARLTASLYSKARRAGFAFMASRSAVTTAALSKAVSQNVTLVGFCRPHEGRLTIFNDSLGRIRS